MSWFSHRPRTVAQVRPPPEPELPENRTMLVAGVSDADEIRNLAMALVLMWGPSRSLPAVDRLLHFVTGLDRPTAEAMVADARQVEKIVNNHVYDHSDYTGKHVAFAPLHDVEPLVRPRFPWVDQDNLQHLYSQSCYYAWHG